MPELPEVESARAVIERNGLRRRIADVDDSDAFVCRPHRARGKSATRCSGGEFVTAMRRGKSMWCQTGPSSDAVTLGIHLGMSGKIVIADADGTEVDGGDYWERGRQPGDYRWARFTVTFADGGRLILVDPRRLGRVRLNPPVDQLGPDAQLITPAQFRAALTAGRHRAGQGAAHGPAADRRHRQPAGRRDPVARPGPPRPGGRQPDRGGGKPAAPGQPRHDQGGPHAAAACTP